MPELLGRHRADRTSLMARIDGVLSTLAASIAAKNKTTVPKREIQRGVRKDKQIAWPSQAVRRPICDGKWRLEERWNIRISLVILARKLRVEPSSCWRLFCTRTEILSKVCGSHGC